MKKSFLYLIIVGVLSVLTACGNDEQSTQHYAVEKKQQIEKDLNKSLEINKKRLDDTNN